MIALGVAALVGGAAFLATLTLLGGDAVRAVGVAILAIIVADVIRDASTSERDRRTAYDRWREWLGHG